MQGFIVLTVCLAAIVCTVSSQSCQPQSGSVIQIQIPPYGSGYGTVADECSKPPATKCMKRGQQIRADYQLIPYIGAYKIHTQALSWNDARLKCESEGGYLSILNSEEESEALKDLFARSPAVQGSPHPDFVAVGFHDLFKEGTFVTIHGDSIVAAGFDRFAGGQPDNAGGNENCGSIHKNGLLNDINCTTPFGFICELVTNE